ncbi:hypothetical protein [Wolbachia endosymbiont of Chironomus riparius]|uniref:hypothetical protein n=1 Tax=Wolbachia endosymbiont of Chironomus riparius TaxID=2883238 RepID=UPI00209F2958|nr:hypothetical protein [Wolbachia endosymbiont of Chironomus riparius]
MILKQALAAGVDVNAYDEDGMIPLMNIALTYTTIPEEIQSTFRKMALILTQHKGIKINAKSNQPVNVSRVKTYNGYPIQIISNL